VPRGRENALVIGGETRIVALLGHPVAHSLSPRMQNAAFAARGLDYAYVAFDVPPERVEEAVRGLAALGFAGANVTIPHKLAVAALRFVETELESVNTLVFRASRIEGHSTDTAVLENGRWERPVVIGDGGSARAFLEALPHARVFSRRGEWPPRTDGADLVVHATPVRDEVLFEPRPGQTVVDLPYPDSATARVAREAGATVLDALDVLVAQGAASFELWTGMPAPVAVMRAAVASAA
jgi:shikimate dehydrogenase